MSKRIVFTFDEQAYKDLQNLTADTKSKSLANTVRESLRLAKAYQKHSGRGFTEIVLRNPNTKKELTLVF